MRDKSWHDALSQAGLSGGPGPSIPVITRREQVSELRALHRRMGRRHGYLKMIIAAVVTNTVLAWSLMITAGILHASWWHAMPTLGYHTASLVTGVLLLGVFGAILTIQTARDLS